MSQDFNAFYHALQQSALYYSNLALRQKQIGYQNQIPLYSYPHSLLHRKVNLSNIALENVCAGSVPIPNKSLKNVAKKHNNLPHIIRTSVKGSSLTSIPPVMISTEENYHFEEDACEINQKSQRKVYFAHPLSTVKIKSPTPHYSFEDRDRARARAVGRTNKTLQGHRGAWGDGGDLAYFMVSASSDENENLATVPEIVISSEMESCEEEPEVLSKRKRKRRKNRGNKDHRSWHDYVVTNDLSCSLEDPYVIYEVPLREDDYEFISEVRLCTNEGTVTIKAETGAETETTKELDTERKEEMNQLYGVLGAERIIKMEDSIEANFEMELRLYNL